MKRPLRRSPSIYWQRNPRHPRCVGTGKKQRRLNDVGKVIFRGPIRRAGFHVGHDLGVFENVLRHPRMEDCGMLAEPCLFRRRARNPHPGQTAFTWTLCGP